MWPDSVSVLISSVAPAQTEHSCKPDAEIVEMFLSNQLYVMTGHGDDVGYGTGHVG